MTDMIIYGSLLILFVILIRAFTIKKLPKKIFVVLWLGVICRLLIPFNMPAVINIYPAVNVINEITEVKTPEMNTTVNDENYSIFINQTIPNENIDIDYKEIQKKTISIENVLPIVWIAGIIVTLMLFIVPHWKNKQRYKSALPIENEYILFWKSQHALKRKYKILQSDEIFSPFTYGILNPVIILPCDILTYDNNTIDYILTHEYVHIKRFDILKKWLAMIALCVHWFNPLVWLMYKMMNNDIEIACDEKVIKLKGMDNRAYYANILIEMASLKPNYSMLVNNFNKNIIKQRIRLIMKTTKITFKQIVLCLLIISFTFVINITSYAVVKEDTVPNLNINDNIEETKTIDINDYSDYIYTDKYYTYLLLDVEMYTSETYYEDVYAPFMEEYNNNPRYADKETYYWVDRYIESMEKTIESLKHYNHRVFIGKTVNGKSCKELGFPIQFSITNNGNDFYQEAIDANYTENGYYKFPMPNWYELRFAYANEDGNIIVEEFILTEDENKKILKYDEYVELLQIEVVPYCKDLLEQGLISESFYKQITSPLEYYIELFF